MTPTKLWRGVLSGGKGEMATVAVLVSGFIGMIAGIAALVSGAGLLTAVAVWAGAGLAGAGFLVAAILARPVLLPAPPTNAGRTRHA